MTPNIKRIDAVAYEHARRSTNNFTNKYSGAQYFWTRYHYWLKKYSEAGQPKDESLKYCHSCGKML
jgi:hypothetical protein